MTGERIGPWILEAELGSGGMGKVYRARGGGRVPGLSEGEIVALGLAVLAEVAGDPGKAIEEARRARAVFAAADYRVGLAEADLVLGRLLAGAGQAEDARTALEAALDAGQRHDYPGPRVLASCRLAALSGAGAEEGRETFEALSGRLRFDERLEARLLLHDLTGDQALLEEAWSELSAVRDHTPEDFRESLLLRVPVHRRIARAHDAL